MNNLKFNFAAVISIIVLLFYSYVVFMGLVYWLDGKIWKGVLYTVLLIAVVLVCVFFMCKARATRWADHTASSPPAQPAGCPPAKGGDAFFTITPRLQVHDYSVSAGFWKPCDHTLSAGNRKTP